MSTPASQHEAEHVDPIESLTSSIPWVLPLAGGLMIFLLAFIAVFMA